MNREDLSKLADILNKLPEIERNIVVLHYYYKNTFDEIGDRLNIASSKVKELHEIALNKIEKEL